MFRVLLAFAALLLLAVPASAGSRYCTASCDTYVVTPPPAAIHVAPRRAVHGHVTVRRIWRPEAHDRRVHVLRERPRHVRHLRRAKRHHVRRAKVRRAKRHHVRRVPVRRAKPRRLYAPNTHMRGRTRFCSDHVERAGRVTFRRCVQVRNDLLGH